MRSYYQNVLSRSAPAVLVVLGAAWALLAAARIFSWAVLPLQDLPDWVFQAELLQAWLAGSLPAEYEFGGSLPPNSFATVAIGVLGLLVGVDVAARVLVWVAVLLLPFAIWQGFATCRPRSPRCG